MILVVVKDLTQAFESNENWKNQGNTNQESKRYKLQVLG